MTDAHCHVTGGDPSVREFLIGRDFIGVHPWEAREEGTGNRNWVNSVVGCRWIHVLVLVKSDLTG